MSDRPLLLLIDGSHALFRAYFAIRNLRGPDGRPTNAVFGWTSMLLKLLDEHRPDYVAACFDGPTRGFRVEIDPAYKANRPPTPPELREQWPIALRLTEELGVKLLQDERLEADDLIATLTERGVAEDIDVLVASGDKDLMALVRDGRAGGPSVRQLDEKKGKSVVYDEAAVVGRWGVPPTRIGDLLAIMGDSVDNVPGVRGIGRKGAIRLLDRWGDFESIYAHLEQVQPARARKLLRESERAARRSRRLVELVRDADPGLSIADLARAEPRRKALTASFSALGFKRLLRRYFERADQVSIAVQPVRDAARLAAIAAELAEQGRVGVCAITSERDEGRRAPMRGELVGLALAGRARTFYVPVRRPRPSTNGDLFATPEMSPGLSVQELVRAVGPLLADAAVAKVGHDLKYLAIVLGRAGLELRGPGFDTMLAAYLLHAGHSVPGLSHLGLELLGCRLASFEATFGTGRHKVGPAAVEQALIGRFCGERAAVPLRLEAPLRERLREAGLMALHDELDLPLSAVLADLERRGVLIDVAELRRQSADLGRRCDELQEAIHAHAGVPFNVASPKQLGVVLFETLGLPAGRRTKTGWSTNQATLEKLRGAHPIIDDLFSWRQLSKLKGTYTDTLPALVHPETGRVHTSFNQAVAATGRLSSSDPNLQNIPIRTPEGRVVRRAFIAPPGRVLLSADYSQIELRVMAHLADEPTMQAAFAAGLDIHRRTAAQIYGIDLEQVTPAQRTAAKTVNFGVLYGMGSTRLAAAIGVSRDEAKAFIERYFERFSRIRAWVDATLARARAHREVRTLYGRRRLIEDINSGHPGVRAAAERIAVNTPVQGTAADIIKRAMLGVHVELERAGGGARMLLHVHDELVLEVPDDEIEATADLVVRAMTGAAELKVPLRVEARWGRDWASAHG